MTSPRSGKIAPKREVEEAPDLTPADDELLDRVWDSLGRPAANADDPAWRPVARALPPQEPPVAGR
jgi:hypothetical protein